MSDHPVFSVIVPLFNGARYIASALDSVAAQTFKDLEMVICDDGSTDNSMQVVREYSRTHPQMTIKYVYQKNKGLGGARNTAIRHASGEYLALLDQDDRWYPDKLMSVYKVFCRHPEVDYVGHNEAVGKSGKVVGASNYGPVSRDFFRQLLFKGNCLSTSASVFRKTVMERVGYFSEDRERVHFVEDYDLWLRMARAGCRFYVLSEMLGEYVLHDQNHSFNLELMYRHVDQVVRDNWRELGPKRFGDEYRFRTRIVRLHLGCSYNLIRRGQWQKGMDYLLKAAGAR